MIRFVSIFFIFLFLHVDLHADTNSTKPTLSPEQIKAHKEAINVIDFNLKGNMWLTRYGNYILYEQLLSSLKSIDRKLKNKRAKRLSKVFVSELKKNQEVLQKQLELLKEFENSPFEELVKPPPISEVPKISNPIAIISGFSYIKQLQEELKTYKKKLEDLNLLIETLSSKEKLIKILNDKEYNKELETLKREIKEFSQISDISKTTFAVYNKKLDEAKATATSRITIQAKRAFNIAIFIILVVLLSFIFKYIAKKYIKDNVRFYMANKIINFINVTIIIMILLFAYIENVTYVVTVIGFASAGIAIAMKDMFMSLLGWMVIVFGGSFHVGDRIKVRKDGSVFVGDIIDISFLRMTILEDITYTSYTENRRSGRVIFVPNNYIFTELIANYTHITLKTVWDGIDVTITFDSNHKKAMYLINNITKKYSKGYTGIAKKQLNKLRHQYSLKNTNVEPRIYSFLEPHGLTISTWYQTNSYAALALRSTLSAEIVEAINKEKDITIAYPTQTIKVNTERKIQELNINKDVLF